MATIEAIQKNPKCSNAVFRASKDWAEDVRCVAKIREFTPMSVEEPAALGGTDVAPNPVELVLAALGTCQEIMYSAYAAVMGIQLTKVSVDVKGYLDLRGFLALTSQCPRDSGISAMMRALKALQIQKHCGNSCR